MQFPLRLYATKINKKGKAFFLQIEYQSLSGRKTRLTNFNRLVGHTVREDQ
nr:MAG TPA: hypothetical protein [Caudoviricetes sp.]